MANKLHVLQVSPDSIAIPEGFNRDRSDSVADGILHRSIEQSGIQQPLVLLGDGESLWLVDGLRRLDVAKALGIPRVPAVVDALPVGENDVHRYAARMRFILDEHRQDLLPSQKGALIAELKRTKKFTNADLAKFLGVDNDSVTNWLAILKYIPEVVQAMDTGFLTMRGARVFDGMSEEGQMHIWANHKAELTNKENRANIHRRLRAQYPPDKNPTFYRSAKLVAERMNRGQARRSRKSELAAEKKKLTGTLKKRRRSLPNWPAKRSRRRVKS